jgi:type II protein arginine methyltransferase
MMNDAARNDAYDAAIRAQSGDGQTVLDIGSGSGLLSMMAARSGAARVYACDDNKTLASAVTFISNQNGLGDRVQAIAKRSTDLQIGVDLPDRADALVCEIFDVSAFGEDALHTIRHAREHLLNPGATIIPNGVRVWAAPVRSDDLRSRFKVGTVCGSDLSPMNALADKRTFQLDLRRIPYTTLAEPFVALEVDFRGDIELLLTESNDVPVTGAGDVDGFILWYDLVLGGSNVLSTAPTGASTHWLQAFLPQWTPLSVSEGDTLRVATEVRRQVIWFEAEVAPDASTAPPEASAAEGGAR